MIVTLSFKSLINAFKYIDLFLGVSVLLGHFKLNYWLKKTDLQNVKVTKKSWVELIGTLQKKSI